jgi:hypothetical protein
MKYLIAHAINFPGSIKTAGKVFCVDGPKQELRRARRSGSITARQQIKGVKLHRRMVKIAAALSKASELL